MNIESDKPDILNRKLEAAIRKMKPFQSPGPGEITSEVIQVTGELCIEVK